MSAPNSSYASVTAILARALPCDCSECQVEALLAGEFGPELSGAPETMVQLRRTELRQQQAKRRKLTSHLSAYQIAKLATEGGRIGAISARLEQFGDGRKARWIDCDAFWALVKDHADLHDGFVPLPTREQHDALKLRFARPVKRKAA